MGLQLAQPNATKQMWIRFQLKSVVGNIDSRMIWAWMLGQLKKQLQAFAKIV